MPALQIGQVSKQKWSEDVVGQVQVDSEIERSHVRKDLPANTRTESWSSSARCRKIGRMSDLMTSFETCLTSFCEGASENSRVDDKLIDPQKKKKKQRDGIRPGCCQRLYAQRGCHLGSKAHTT